MKQKHPFLRHFIAPYTILFAITAFAVFFPFIDAGKSLVWDSDAIHQHLNAFIYLGRWLREIATSFVNGDGFVIPLWDFSLGYGADILTTLHYYAFGDPLNLVSALVPARYAENAYGCLIIVRIYLAGLFFLLYAKKLGASSHAAIAGSLIYSFCGWTLFGAIRHPYFMNPLIYLPLLLLGFEKIYRKENPALFIASVFIAAISNFYFFYMLLIAVVFFALLRFLSGSPRSFRAFAKLFARSFGYGCIGVLMACVLLIPVISLFLNTERASIQLLQDPLYGLSFYLQFPLSYLTPAFNQNWTCLGFASTALLSIVALFFLKGHSVPKFALLFLTLLLLLPQAGSLFNGFSYATNRWCWIYSFAIALIATTVWDKLPDLARRRRTGLSFAIVTAVFIAIVLAVLYPLSSQAFPNIAAESARAAAIPPIGMLAITVLATCALPHLVALLAPHKQNKLVSLTLIGLTVISIAVTAQSTYDVLNTPDQYLDNGKAYTKIKSTAATDAAKIQKEEPDFSRFEAQRLGVMNPADIVGARGVHYYWSLGPAPISQYYTELGLSTRRTAYSYSTLEKRAPLYALASVKYYIGRDGTEPYGFLPVPDYPLNHSRKGSILFENENALPLGYTYRAYFSTTEFESLPLEARQEALLEGAVIPDDIVDSLPSEIRQGTLRQTQETIPATITYNGEEIASSAGLTLKTSDAPGELSLSFSGLPNSETYLVLTDISAELSVGDEGHWGMEERLRIDVASQEHKTHLKLPTDYFRWTTGQRDFLVNLGYSNEGRTCANLSFPANASYTIGSIKVVCQPMDSFDSQVQALREESLDNVALSANTVTGDLSLSEDKILCLSIPYDKGWRAEVDGQPAELSCVNIMFMGLPVTQGNHHIALYYETVGLKEGLCASALGCALFVIALIRHRSRYHSRKRSSS